MKDKQRLKITMETYETTIIRFKQNSTKLYCAGCGYLTRHLSIAQAVSVFSLSENEIKSLAEKKQIHLKETEDGFFLLCGNSLTALAEKKNI